MKSWKLEAVILAIGMLVMGYFIKQGLDTFSGKDRVVNVKGLAEMEVPANKVTWPLMYKDLGNDLPTLYNKINATNQAIRQLSSKVPIVAVTAFAYDEDKRKVMSRGFNGYLSKPLNKEALFDMLRQMGI